MKTTLFTVALILASHFSNAQRIHETTQQSWDFPNLSVETYKDFVISGFTERGPSGYLNPTFKISTISGSPVTAFNIDYSDDFFLMDFTIRDKAHSIIFTGVTAALGGGIHKMIVAEVDLMTGTPIQSSIQYDVNGGQYSLMPHQVIHSEPNNQVIIVGSEIYGPLDPSNYAFVPKSGFVMGLDINNYNTTAFATVKMDTWGASNWDYDMLENVTEVNGWGYFMSGSCNEPSGKQSLHTMGIDYSGTVMFSNIIDNSNSRFAGSSVMYNQPLDVVYLMANNSAMHQFQLAICDPYSGNFMGSGNWVSHQMTSLPVPIGSGIDQNGFRLQQSVENLIVVGGYLSAPGGALPALLTPFQITMRDDLKFAAAKVYQSDNNSPLSPSYFEENGNSVFINTPDVIVYNRFSKRTYLVNQNKNYAGFDLHVSSLLKPSKCEKAHKVTTFQIPPNFIGNASPSPIDIQGFTYMPNAYPRPIMEHILCQEVAPLPIVTNPNPATLSPNPASAQLRISLDEEMIQGVLVYDMKGNVVLTEKATERSRNVMNLNIGKLNQGAYILEITTEEGTIHHEKFVKE